MFHCNFDTMTHPSLTAPEPSADQVQSSPVRFVFATFHGQDRFGRNTTSREILAVSAKATLDDWLAHFEDLAIEVGKKHDFRDVAIAYRFDGEDKEPTVWEYLQNFLRPKFGLRFVDIGPTW